MKICLTLYLSLFLSFSIVAQPELGLVEIATGFSSPVALTNAGDGSDRLFIVERNGIIKIFDLATQDTLPTPFMNISNRVESGGEKGLLGLTFHPDYPNTPHCFVNYTFRENTQLKTKIERYSVSSEPNVADTSTALRILSVDQPYSNHNAGDIKFGPDGFLYVTMGDGGSGGDPDSLAQNTLNLLGSLLRLDIDNDDFPADPNLNYAIPGTNPFVGMAGFREEFWAIGLRNPWRISFDRMTGDLWIADVGQSSREEIDFQINGDPGGQNYGWSCKEGSLIMNFNECIPGPLTDPIFEYPRTDGGSVTGGFVYRGSSFPQLQGFFIFADYSSGNFWMLNSTDFNDFTKVSLIGNISTFGESDSGELYAMRLTGGILYRVFDFSICEDELAVPDHNQSEYISENLLTSALTVTDVQDISYFSSNIELEESFGVEIGGIFKAEGLSCSQKIAKEQY